MLQKPFTLTHHIILILLLLSAFCFLSKSMSTFTKQTYPSFDEFASQYHKHYDSSEEKTKRQNIYKTNVETVKNTGSSSSTINYFSDWTTEQLQKLTTLKTSEKQQNLASTLDYHQQKNVRSLQETTPRVFDWRNITTMTNVKNTGLCGASWAFSTVAFFEQLAVITGSANSTIDLSEMYLIACNPESQQCNAGQVQSSIDLVIDRGGLPLEAKYPYNSTSTGVTNTCLETDFFGVKNQTRMSYFRISDPQTIKKIVFKKPVIASVCGSDFLTYSPQSASDSSRTLKCKPQNRIIDHSVLLIGYTETQWIVKNHWGTGWGINGYAYISRNPSEDCCIGEQLHSSGAITAQCSVQYCQTCVETDTCYKCEPGRWVKHNTTTGVQTCEPCTETNCTEFYNYRGTCKWCSEGFALNSTTGKCVNTSIANCNSLISSALCFQCKPGYRLSSSRNACNSFCVVKNCDKCPNGPCNQCKPGFTLTTVSVNNDTVPYCAINNCTVANCTYCNTTGSCVQCANSFTLQLNGSCTTNCTAFPFCASCSGSTSCSECIVGRSYNSSKRTCEVFSGATNCRVHRTTCTSCRTGYTLSSGQCLQNCESTSCLTCVPNDISYCLTCANGYFLNRTAVYSVCTANPCNVISCSLCNASGGCVLCTNKFHVFNASANRCQSQCALQNCRDCLPNAVACSFCNVGYGIDSIKKTCISSNISNCMTIFVTSNATLQCFTCETKYYLMTSPIEQCLVWCTDMYCLQCQPSSLHICERCFDGFYPKLINGMAVCTLIPSTMMGCDKISLNQTYCYACNSYYIRNERTGVCENNTKNCPQMCESCTISGAKYFGCRCYSGFVFDFDTQTCLKNPFEDTNCLMMQFQISDYYCLECPQGMVLNAAWNGCDTNCIVPGCLACSNNDNTKCTQCSEGSYLGPNGYSCIKCPIANCSKCSSAACFDCQLGFELSNNNQNCSQIVCMSGFVYNGYGCLCPVGSYQDGDQCKVCSNDNCIQCSHEECFECQSGYYLENRDCRKCPTNCRVCNASHQCFQCNNRYTLLQNHCIFLNSQSSFYYTNGSSIIRCQQNCIQCDLFGNCLKCQTSTANYLGVCINCQGYCKTCLFRNTSICTSCHQAFFLNQTNCLKCKELNCLDCTTSPQICITCKDGFYLQNNTCQPCMIQNCLSCDFNGKCTKCSSGFTLLSNNSCEQCAGNCRKCNPMAINQCLLECNRTSYQSDGQCYSCPNSCKTCLSNQICLSCINGYQIRNNSCIQKCQQEGCVKCDPGNSSLCLECFSGYLLTQNGTCPEHLACNDNQSCTQCPKKWTLVNNNCQSCNLSANCTQCAIGNISLCIQCQSGFFLYVSTCALCGSNCLECLSFDMCSQCIEGFFIPRGQIYANCTPCDRNCKTCEQFSTKCLTCSEGYELSVAQKCVTIQKINGTIELNLQFSSFLSYSRQIRSDLLGLIGEEYRNENGLYIITNLKEGSTILSFNLAIPDGKDPEETFNNFRQNITRMPAIGGVELISIKRLQFADPTRTETLTLIQTNDQELNKLAIILGVVIPSVVIMMVIVGFVIKKRGSAGSNNAVGNDVVGLDDTKEQVQVNRKSKLPPIAHRPTDFTPVKYNQVDQFGSTANNDTFLITPQQQSYEHFFDNNEENRPEIVNEFNSRIQNEFKSRIQDELNNPNVNQAMNRNEEHEISDKMELGLDSRWKQSEAKQKQGKDQDELGERLRQNQQGKEVQFADDTSRKMKQNLTKQNPNAQQVQIQKPDHDMQQ